MAWEIAWSLGSSPLFFTPFSRTNMFCVREKCYQNKFCMQVIVRNYYYYVVLCCVVLLRTLRFSSLALNLWSGLVMPLLKVHAMIENKKMMQVVHYDTIVLIAWLLYLGIVTILSVTIYFWIIRKVYWIGMLHTALLYIGSYLQ